MAWKNLAQTDLSDALIQHHPALEELDGINALIDWSRLERQLSGLHNKAQGEQAWPPLMMFSAIAPALPYLLHPCSRRSCCCKAGTA
jgi:transposase, IS5 family